MLATISQTWVRYAYDLVAIQALIEAVNLRSDQAGRRHTLKKAPCYPTSSCIHEAAFFRM